MPDVLAEQLRLLVAREQSERRIPSVSACVFRDGEVVWADAIGLADVAAAREATIDTQYRIGSITKTFTAAAIMQLRDAGSLALDDALSEHIDESPHPSLTLRRLLSHLSGIQREAPGEVWESLKLPTREEFLAQLADAEMVLEPGERWHYSNLAFNLLGEVVERRAEMPWAQYVEERLFRPLGLARTTLHAQEPHAHGYFVEPYSETVLPEKDVDLGGTASSGQLWSTTADLARWGAFLADPDPEVLSAKSVEAMHSVQVMMDTERWAIGWGLGLELWRMGDRVYAGHGGAMPGHIAALVVQRRERVGAAVLMNTSANALPDSLALSLAEKTFELAPTPPKEWRPQDAAPPELDGVLGRWFSEGWEFIFRFRDGKLEARAAAAPEHKEWAVFEPDGLDRYRAVSGREHGELLRVVRDDGGAVTKLYWATYPFTRDARVFG